MCEFTLSNTNQKQTNYDVRFNSLCDRAVNSLISTNETKVKLLVPLAELKIFDSSGKLTIKWNVEMAIPSNQTRQLQENFGQDN